MINEHNEMNVLQNNDNKESTECTLKFIFEYAVADMHNKYMYLTCSSNTGYASYRCFIIYSSNSSSRDKCNNCESFIGVLTASLQRTAPLPVTNNTDFFCIKFREWNRKRTSWACSMFKSANTYQ